jgi:hypothetical protein
MIRATFDMARSTETVDIVCTIREISDGNGNGGRERENGDACSASTIDTNGTSGGGTMTGEEIAGTERREY